MALHLSRVAFGATALSDLIHRVESQAVSGEVRLTTRFLPKRHAEIVAGGSLFWIIKHHLVARAKVKGFEPAAEGRTNIVLEARIIPVRPMPRRAHQGWRYLDDIAAPQDLGMDAADGADLPDALRSDLAALALI